MNNIFVNFSNHPSSLWNLKQIEESNKYGQIVDIPFPAVSPYSTSEEIDILAEEYVQRIIGYCPAAVQCQGEFTLCYNVVNKLKSFGIVVVAATSERNVVVEGDKKTAIFNFVQYREY